MQALGIGKGDRVAILLPNGEDWLALFYGAALIGAVTVPVQSDGSFYVYFGRHDDQRFISAADVFSGETPQDHLAGKLVLIGVSGLGLLDFQATPLGERIPGVEVHAQILEQIVDGVYLHRPAGAAWIEAMRIDRTNGRASFPVGSLRSETAVFTAAGSYAVPAWARTIEIVAIGKQLLMTRGSLTTFSIANDVAKYFAIIPALFVVAYPELEALNVMKLASPQSAILSAVIFNALIIIALIPLALKGVRYRAIGAAALLRRHLWIYGVGGVILPFIGIKLIDLLLVALRLV